MAKTVKLKVAFWFGLFAVSIIIGESQIGGKSLNALNGKLPVLKM